jgi:hypothetical protein
MFFELWAGEARLKVGKLQFGVARNLVWFVLASPVLCWRVIGFFQCSNLKKKEIDNAFRSRF